MQPIDYIILGGLAVVIVFISLHLVKRKKEGKGGCGCGCSSCPSAGSCAAAQKNTKEEEK